MTCNYVANVLKSVTSKSFLTFHRVMESLLKFFTPSRFTRFPAYFIIRRILISKRIFVLNIFIITPRWNHEQNTGEQIDLRTSPYERWFSRDSATSSYGRVALKSLTTMLTYVLRGRGNQIPGQQPRHSRSLSRHLILSRSRVISADGLRRTYSAR